MRPSMRSRSKEVESLTLSRHPWDSHAQNWSRRPSHRHLVGGQDQHAVAVVAGQGPVVQEAAGRGGSRAAGSMAAAAIDAHVGAVGHGHCEERQRVSMVEGHDTAVAGLWGPPSGVVG